jgi:competence protein ComEA
LKSDKIIASLQSFFGVTKSEIIFAILVLGGLLFGVGLKIFNYQPSGVDNEKRALEIYRILDSLAEANKTTFIGTDMEGNVVPELAAGDTIVKSAGMYPEKPVKTIPKERINIATASRVQLMNLPGVGEKTADLIIEYRTTHRFRKIEDLMNVKGIGPKKFENFKEYIEIK